MSFRIGFIFLVGFAVTACGGSPPPEPTAPAPVTTGDEEPESDGPVTVMRTTIPVPVPSPPVPREELPEALQVLWTATELYVADRPPEPPTVATLEELERWSREDFVPWMTGRQEEVQGLEPQVAEIGEDRVMLAIAAALFGYMYEDTAAGIRGAPVPATIAEDQELLDIYVEQLSSAVRPFAERSLESYAFCATSIVEAGAEAWASWAEYCALRGQEVGDVYGLGRTSE